jgi:hypothetical protein
MVGLAGEGKLRDGNEAAKQFREFLASIPSAILARYVSECRGRKKDPKRKGADPRWVGRGSCRASWAPQLSNGEEARREPRPTRLGWPRRWRIGGASSESYTGRMHLPRVLPIFPFFHQPCADRVLPHIAQESRWVFLIPKPVMESFGLPVPSLIVMRLAEVAFPILEPLLNREAIVARHGEKVEVVGHKHV